MGQVITVTSGKGGVGKSLSSIHLALNARASGARTLLIDADFGLSNIDVLLGMEPKFTLADVLNGTCSIHDLLLKGPRGIEVITSGSGISKMANLGPLERAVVISELRKIQDDYQYIIVDTGAGISPSTLALNAVSDLLIVVTTPEPHALTDGYAMIKVMAEEYGIKTCGLLVNQVRSDEEGTRIAQRLAEVAFQYTNVNVNHLGSIRIDSTLLKSVMARNVAWEGCLQTLANQGWSFAWRKIQSKFQSEKIVRKNNKLSEVWSALAAKNMEESIL